MSVKKFIVTSLLTLTALFFLPFFVHNEIIDYFNVAIPKTYSYAQVPKNTQKYFNVQAYDSKTGRKLPYKIKKVGGYDPSRQYIKIVHKGQYVKEIKYVSKKEFQKKVHS
ncbi:YxeA family protein [Lactobacillus huangpiensis]|uniref:YxeA family protein n=1 Tax=Lactobacillus huangpiensis TaxID=2799571 RepID=UPI001CC700D4|nr:YxeA family protein [Lactobacillus huangpiensis]